MTSVPVHKYKNKTKKKEQTEQKNPKIKKTSLPNKLIPPIPVSKVQNRYLVFSPTCQAALVSWLLVAVGEGQRQGQGGVWEQPPLWGLYPFASAASTVPSLRSH